MRQSGRRQGTGRPERTYFPSPCIPPLTAEMHGLLAEDIGFARILSGWRMEYAYGLLMRRAKLKRAPDRPCIMLLDLPTSFVITGFTFAIAGGLLLQSWLQHRNIPALALWALSFVLA